MVDCTRAGSLTDGFRAQTLLADKAYETDEIIAQAQARDMGPVIPPKNSRKNPRPYDEYLYQMRHPGENAIPRLKGWRGIANRYVKKASSFLAIAQIRCLFLWASIS